MTDEEWRALYEAFDPWKPAPAAWRADRGKWTPIDRIRRSLARPAGERRFLLIGTPGAGKTTELLRLAEERSSASFVVSLDLWRHFQDQMKEAQAIERVQAWEVVVLVALAVMRAGREQLGIDWSAERQEQLRKAIATLRNVPPDDPSLDLGKLAGGLLVVTSVTAGAYLGGPAGAATGAAAAGAGSSVAKDIGGGLKELAASVQWKLPFATSRSERRDDQEGPVRALLDATNALIGEVQTRHKPVLLILDGLDRVTQEDAVRGLFVESSLLGQLEATTVLTGPLSLLHAKLVRQVRGFAPQPLENVPVLDERDAGQHGPGVTFFEEVVRRRGAADVLPAAHTRRLAWASGGVIRDFLKLVQSALASIYDRGLAAIDAVAVEEAVDELRRQVELGLTREDVTLLGNLAADPHHELPDDPRTPRLLATFCILPYPNGTTWWHPHPVLTLLLLKRRPGSPA